MKRSLRLPITLALSFAVFVFSISCCCFVHPVQAKEETPPCHQTEHQEDQSSDNQECDCHKDLISQSQLEKTSIVDPGRTFLSIVPDDRSLSGQPLLHLTKRKVSESPPYSSSGVPLYIKHSVFRV